MGDLAVSISNGVKDLIDACAGETETIRAEARQSTTAAWRELQIAKATALGAGAAIIPVAGYLTLPADVAATLRIMHRAATGIAELELGVANDETFAGILAIWSGAVTLDNGLAKQVGAKVMAGSATTIGGKAGLKLSIHAFNLCTSALVAKKLGPKVATKVAAKVSQKLAAKATTRWIPIISALAGGGVNYWMVAGVCDAAVEYAAFIRKAR